MWENVAYGPCTPLKEDKGIRLPLHLDDKEIRQSGFGSLISSDYKAKLVLTDALTEEEYNKVGTCRSAKEMWDMLEAIYGNEQVVQEKLYDLGDQLMKFRMKVNKLSAYYARSRSDLR